MVKKMVVVELDVIPSTQNVGNSNQYGGAASAQNQFLTSGTVTTQEGFTTSLQEKLLKMYDSAITKLLNDKSIPDDIKKVKYQDLISKFNILNCTGTSGDNETSIQQPSTNLKQMMMKLIDQLQQTQNSKGGGGGGEGATGSSTDLDTNGYRGSISSHSSSTIHASRGSSANARAFATAAAVTIAGYLNGRFIFGGNK